MSPSSLHPTGVLHNTVTGRYHPITFFHAPPPSGDLADGTGRYKSMGHHTEGFATKEAAVKWIDTRETLSLLNNLWEWDGQSSPAMVIWLKCVIATKFEEAACPNVS